MLHYIDYIKVFENFLKSEMRNKKKQLKIIKILIFLFFNYNWNLKTNQLNCNYLLM